MLVLSRKQQQEIVIGDNIRVTVLKVKGNTVRLGIEAPREVHVVRGELPARKEESKIANITVVFENPSTRAEQKGVNLRAQPKGEKTGKNPGGGSQADLLQFKPVRDEAGCSISFRQATPESLRHNRLKEIVRKISEAK